MATCNYLPGNLRDTRGAVPVLWSGAGSMTSRVGGHRLSIKNLIPVNLNFCSPSTSVVCLWTGIAHLVDQDEPGFERLSSTSSSTISASTRRGSVRRTVQVAKTRGDGYVLPRTRHPMMMMKKYVVTAQLVLSRILFCCCCCRG